MGSDTPSNTTLTENHASSNGTTDNNQGRSIMLISNHFYMNEHNGCGKFIIR